MSRRINLLVGVGLLGTLAVPAVKYTTVVYARHHETALVREYAGENFDTLLSMHPARISVIKPVLTFEPPANMPPEKTGAYDFHTNSVYVNAELLCTPQKLNTPELQLHNIATDTCRNTADMSMYTADKLLRHELTHFFTYHRAMRRMGEPLFRSEDEANLTFLNSNKNFNGISGTATYMASLSRKILNEGIAEYYKNQTKASFSPHPYATSSSQRDDSPIYDDGRALVWPIMNKYGAAGIDIILCNLPQITAITELQQWQNHIMQFSFPSSKALQSSSCIGLR